MTALTFGVDAEHLHGVVAADGDRPAPEPSMVTEPAPSPVRCKVPWVSVMVWPLTMGAKVMVASCPAAAATFARRRRRAARFRYGNGVRDCRYYQADRWPF